MPKQFEKWEAESDARALTDSGRMSRAKLAAKKMVKTQALKKVAQGTIKRSKK